MKKKYAYNTNTGEKLFCKTETAPTGVLFVSYYLPQYGFSVIWVDEALVKIHKVREIKDGNRIKTIVTYAVHPTYFMGASFEHCSYGTTQDAIDEIFTNYINTHV